VKITDTGISFADTQEFMLELKARVVELVAYDDAGDVEAEHALGLEISQAILCRHPIESSAIVLSAIADLVRAEATIKELESRLEVSDV
jgi:hypothetical protein